MAKRKVSFADYQEPTWDEYTGEDPPVGKWYNGTVNRAKYLEENDQMVFYITIVDDPDYNGWTRGWYADFEGELKWKMHEILRALQGGATKDVDLDWENETAVANWLKRQKKIRFQTGEYNDRIQIRKPRPLVAAVPGGTSGKKGAAPAPAPAAEPDEEPVDDYTEDELNALEVADLEGILEEEFDLPKDDEDFPKKGRRDRTGAKYKADLVEAILAEQEGEDDADGDDGDEADDQGEEFDDGFEADPEPEPEPEPAPRTRRSRAAAPAAKAAPAKAAPATSRRRRG